MNQTQAIRIKKVNPDPSALILLAEIVDAGSVTGAARALGISQPAISKQLKKLEESLGVSVFERGVRGMHATEYGVALLHRAKAIRSQVRQAGEEIAQKRGLNEGKVVVALSHFATIALLPKVISVFKKRWPLVELNIVPPTFQLGGLREGAPDFAVMSLPSEKLGSEYLSRTLYMTSLAIVVRQGHPFENAKSLAELNRAEWVFPSLESSVAIGLRRAFKKSKLPLPKCSVTCQTLTGLETLTRHSDLVAAMPFEVFEERKKASGLKQVLIDESIEGAKVVVLRWRESRPTPAAQNLEEAFANAAYDLAKEQALFRK